MKEIKEAKVKLEQAILAAVKEFEDRFPGAEVANIVALHETGLTSTRVREIEVGVRL